MWRFAIHVALQQALLANMSGTRFTGLGLNEFLSLLTSVHPRFVRLGPGKRACKIVSGSL